MNNYDLSVLIPSRNEMFVAKTVENILANIRGNTEIIVALDGAWANPGIPDDPRLTIIYFPDSVGQRAATNQACRLSKAKYVMKIDAHSVVSEGFDLELIKTAEELKEDLIQIPVLYNLHAFDWVCIGPNPRSGRQYVENEGIKVNGCGHTIYQGPTPDRCPNCGGNMERLLIFKPRLSRKSEFYRFDTTLHFQYHGDRKKHPEAQGQIVETMSAQGSCFFLSRKDYLELNICDEEHGSWGQQGTEVACKAWLSGRRLVTNRNCWYSHMFRTQGGDFGFPYALSGSDVDKARRHSRNLWLNNKFEKQIYPLSWLIEKFKPLPDWHEDSGKEVLELVQREGEEFKKKVQVLSSSEKVINLEPTKAILFYTDNQLNLKIAHVVQKRLRSIGLPITSVSLKPMPNFGNNIFLPLQRGYFTMFKQILAGLEALQGDIVFMCEHDVLYHPSHFDFIPPRQDKFYYNQNFWKIRKDGFAVHWDANQVSGLCAYRELLIDYYRNRIKEIEEQGFNRSYEPGGRNTDLTEAWFSEYPNIDIRHDGTLTKDKWSPNDFRDKSTCVNWQESTVDNIPGWKHYNFIALT